MSPPRRPRNEPPRTTIRILRRQLATAQQTVAALQLDRSDKEKVIAGYDVQLSETQDTAHKIAQSAMARQKVHAEQMAAARIVQTRLAFLEGYYAKSQETAPPPARRIPATRGDFPDHQAQAYASGRSRDPQNLSAQRQAPEGTGADYSAAGIDAGFGDEVRSQHLDNKAPPNRRSMEHIEITERRPSGDRWRGDY